MSLRSLGRLFVPLLGGLFLASGCSSNDPAITENKLHDTKSFTAAELNAPLSPQARARGAQVPPAPTR